MSTFVDERVVEMSFDNKHFEKNVKTSMSTIDKLKNSLDFSGTANSINKEFDSISTGGLSTAIMGAKSSFTAFEVSTIAAIANITNRVIDLGIQMVKSLSTDNIASGWGKLEQSWKKENQLLSQGFEQEEVNEVLTMLQVYADETSYSYSAMLDSVTKMTASGMSLQKSAEAAIGYSNFAAKEGKNAAEAANMMRQIDQVFQSGYMRREDWKSIQNATMGSKEFQEQSLKAAVALKTLNQNVDGTYTTLNGITFKADEFVTSLTEGLWYTKEVLQEVFTSDYMDSYSGGFTKLYKLMQQDSNINNMTEAINKYGDSISSLEKIWFESAQQAYTFSDVITATQDAVSTGWMMVFQNILGQAEEVKVFWSDLSMELYDMFMGGLSTKMGVTNLWGDLGGRDDLFANTEESTGAFWNLFNAIKAIKDLIGGAWQEIFGLSDLETYEERINDIATKLKTFTENLKEWSNEISKFFRDPTEEMNRLLIDSGISLGEITQNIDGTYSDLEGNILDTVDAVKMLKMNADVMKHVRFINGDELGELEKRKQILEVFTNILKGLFSTLKIIGKTVIAVAKGFSPLIEVLKSALWYLLSALGTVGKEITDFSETTDVFEKITDKIRLFSTTVINFVKTFIKYFRESLNKVFGDTDKNSGKLISFKTVIESIVNVLKWFGEIISKYVVPFLSKFFKVLGIGLGWIVGNIIKLVVSIKGIVIGFIEWLKTNERIQNGFLKLKNVLDVVGETFKKVIKNIAEFFKSFGNSDMAPVEEFSGEIEEKFSPLKTFVEGLSNLFQGLWHVIKAIVPVVGALFSFIGNALKSIGDKLKAIFTSGDGEVNFAKLFTVGFWAVVAVGVYRFATFLRTITQVITDAFDSMWDYFNSKSIKAYMEALKTMAISILLMVAALLILGSMDDAALKKSLLAMAALIGFIIGTLILMKKLIAGTSTFTKSGGIFKGIKNMTTTHANLAGLASAFIGLGAAILLLAISLKIISKMDPKELMYGLGIIAIMMVMMTTVMKVLQKSEKGANKVVRSMVKIAVSVALLVRPLKTIGSIDTTTGIKGLIGIASLMTILALFSRFSKAIDKSQKSVFGLISTAIALTILIIPLKVIGGMDIGTLIKAGSSILGLFVIFAVMGKMVSVEDSQKLKDITENLLVVAFALGLFGVAMMIVGLNDWSSIGKSLVSLVGVFTIMVLMNKVLGKQLTKPRVTNMTNTIKSLKGVAVALAMLGVAMLIVGRNDWSSVGKSLVTLLGVFGTLTIMNMVLGNKLTEPRVRNMSNIIWMLIPLSVGLASLGLSMLILGSVPWPKILTALGAMALAMAAIILVDKVLKASGTNAMSMLAISGALVILSYGMILLSVGLLALGSVPLKTIGIALLALAGSLVVLGLAAWALMASGAIVGLIALAITFVIFTAAVFMLNVALTMLAGVMTVSAAAFAAGLIAISAAVIIAAPKIMEALWILVKGVLNIFIKSGSLIVNGFKVLFLELIKAGIEILPTLEKLFEDIVNMIVRLFGVLLNALWVELPSMIVSITGILLELLEGLKQNLPAIVNKLVDIFIGMIRSLRERLPDIMVEMALFLSDWFDSIVLFWLTLIPRLANAFYDLLIGGLNTLGPILEERAAELREAIFKFLGHVWNAILEFFGINSPSTKMIGVATDLIAGLLKGLWDGVTGLLSSIGGWAGKIMGKIGESFGTAWQKGKDLINNIGKGAKSVWSSTSSWFKTKATDISESFKNKVGTMKTVGGDLINGLKSGLKETGEKIKGTVENVANKVTGWFKNIFGINSPSKVFSEMGMFLDLGLAKGIKDHSDSAYDAAQDLGDDTAEGVEKSGLSKVLTDLNKSLESDFDNEVVIRPVLDLSEIQNGKNRLSNMMSDMDSYDISGSNSIANRTRDEINRDSSKFSNNSKDVSGQGVSNSEVINNTFNITGANAKEIADEVSRVLQIQVDRRKAKWAL